MQSNDQYRLVVRRGPQPNQTYELSKDIITVGRDITNDIVINDPEVSRHHMRFTRGGGGFTLEDLGSTNGTFVNGQRLTGARPLNNGDMIGLGETVTLGYELVRAVPGMMPQAPAPQPMQPMQQAPAPQPVQPQPMQPQPMAPQAPQPSYAPPAAPQQPSYDYGAPVAPQASYGQAPQAPAPGYDYDPAAARDEAPSSNLRWIIIGCAVALLFCCCITVISLVLFDQLCLWDRLPIVGDIIRALGWTVVCSTGAAG